MFLVTSAYLELPDESWITVCYEKMVEIMNGEGPVMPATIGKDDQDHPTITRYFPDLEKAEVWRAWVEETLHPIYSIITEQPDQPV